MWHFFKIAGTFLLFASTGLPSSDSSPQSGLILITLTGRSEDYVPDKEKLITAKRLSTDIIIPSHFPQNKRKATILPKSSIKVSIKGIAG